MIGLYLHYIVVNVTGKHKGNHKPTLELLEGPFTKLEEAKQRLTEMDLEKAFVVEGRKISKNIEKGVME